MVSLLLYQVHQALARWRRIGELHPILVRAVELGPQTIPTLELRFPACQFRLEPQDEGRFLLHISTEE